jgi:hypothetical protein
MTIEESAEDGDEVIETEGVRLLVDNFSAMYLQGAEVDYVNSLMGGGFTVHNPERRLRLCLRPLLQHGRQRGDRPRLRLRLGPTAGQRRPERNRGGPWAAPVSSRLADEDS